MSGRRKSATPVVERQYLAEPDACERAIKSLLQSNVRKNPAADPSERGDFDGNTVEEDSTDAGSIPQQS